MYDYIRIKQNTKKMTQKIKLFITTNKDIVLEILPTYAKAKDYLKSQGFTNQDKNNDYKFYFYADDENFAEIQFKEIDKDVFLKELIKNYKIINQDSEYIYSTKSENKLFDYLESTLGYERPKNLNECIKLLEKGNFFLITN